MNVLEMRLRFNEILEESSKRFPDRDTFIDSNTILKYLNDAQIEYIKSTYLSSPSFLERTKIISNSLNDLRNLIRTITLDDVTITPYYDNTLLFKSNLYDIWHYLEVTGVYSRIYPISTTNSIIDMLPIEADNLNNYLTTSINKPVILVPVFTQTHIEDIGTNNMLGLLVIYDSYTTFTSNVITAHCLVKPKKLVFTVENSSETDVCELAEYLHNTIVKIAVNLYDQDKYKLSNKKTE